MHSNQTQFKAKAIEISFTRWNKCNNLLFYSSGAMRVISDLSHAAWSIVDTLEHFAGYVEADIWSVYVTICHRLPFQSTNQHSTTFLPFCNAELSVVCGIATEHILGNYRRIDASFATRRTKHIVWINVNWIHAQKCTRSWSHSWNHIKAVLTLHNVAKFPEFQHHSHIHENYLRWS